MKYKKITIKRYPLHVADVATFTVGDLEDMGFNEDEIEDLFKNPEKIISKVKDEDFDWDIDDCPISDYSYECSYKFYCSK